jgi:sugar lactone lactonase YvrE
MTRHESENHREEDMRAYLSCGLARGAILAFMLHGMIWGQTITTIAGTGVCGFNASSGSDATQVQLDTPVGVAVDAAGNVYISQKPCCPPSSAVVWKVAPDGSISVFAGGAPLGAGSILADGKPATQAALIDPSGLTVDAAGDVYIAAGTLWKVTPDGIIHQVVGNSLILGATQALTLIATWVTLDAAGNLLITDAGDSVILKSDPTGALLSIYAGIPAQPGYSGDNGPANQAQLLPQGVALDPAGNLYIADRGNHRVRVVGTDQTINTIAGTGTPGQSGDGGPALNATLLDPTGVLVDPNGNLYISESKYVHKVTPDGTMTRVAGALGVAYPGDGGPATNAPLADPQGLAMDTAGNLYIVDNSDCRVRKVAASDTPSAPAQVQ